MSGLEDALWNMYVEEEVFDYDNLYYCETCGKLVKAAKVKTCDLLPGGLLAAQAFTGVGDTPFTAGRPSLLRGAPGALSPQFCSSLSLLLHVLFLFLSLPPYLAVS